MEAARAARDVVARAARKMGDDLALVRPALDALWSGGALSPAEYQQRLRQLRHARHEFDRFVESALQRGRRRMSAIPQVHRRLVRPDDWAEALEGMFARAAAVRRAAAPPARPLDSQKQRQLARYCALTRDCRDPCKQRRGGSGCYVARGIAAKNDDALVKGSAVRRKRAAVARGAQRKGLAAFLLGRPALRHRGTPLITAIRSASTTARSATKVRSASPRPARRARPAAIAKPGPRRGGRSL